MTDVPSINENALFAFTEALYRKVIESQSGMSLYWICIKYLYNTTVDSPENTFLSPASLYAALAMTAVGSEGSTREELARILNVSSDLSSESLCMTIGALLNKYFHDIEGVTVAMANLLYTDKTCQTKPEFRRQLKTHFKAEHEQVCCFALKRSYFYKYRWISRNIQRKLVTQSMTVLANWPKGKSMRYCMKTRLAAILAWRSSMRCISKVLFQHIQLYPSGCL